jgi:hypothetical protein
MGAPDLLRSLQGLGLTLTADGERLLVGPSECITDNVRSLIREHKAELLILVGGKENAFARAAVGPSTADLERRIRAMAVWWRYSDEETRSALERAAEDYVRWQSLVEDDERWRAEHPHRRPVVH